MDPQQLDRKKKKKNKSKKRKPQPIVSAKSSSSSSSSSSHDDSTSAKRLKLDVAQPAAQPLPDIKGITPAMQKIMKQNAAPAASKQDKKNKDKKKQKNEAPVAPAKEEKKKKLVLINPDDIDEYDDDEFPVMIDCPPSNGKGAGDNDDDDDDDNEAIDLLSRPIPKRFLSSTGAQSITTDPDLTSTERAHQLFQWMIAPVTVEEFYEHYWERKPLVIKRHQPNYYKGWFSQKDIEDILKKHKLQRTYNVDIVKYTSGKKIVLPLPGDSGKEEPYQETRSAMEKVAGTIVNPDEAWKSFKNGWSIRLLHPQQYSLPVWKMLSVLEDFWGDGVGSNAYLTPAGSQGFAPHYDDVEAFVLQLEGSKDWKLYDPPEDEVLPRFSSADYKPSDVEQLERNNDMRTDNDAGLEDDDDKPKLKLITNVVLEEGDLCYFPRGFVHQAVALKDKHSLHLTVSTALQHTWGDFMEKALKSAVEKAFQNDLNFRRTLPRSFIDYMGVVYEQAPSLPEDVKKMIQAGEDSGDEDRPEEEDPEDPRRVEFKENVEMLFSEIAEILPSVLDSVADTMARDFCLARLPPYALQDKTSESSAQKKQKKKKKKGSQQPVTTSSSQTPMPNISLSTEIRLRSHNIARLVIEEAFACVYTHANNDRIHHNSLAAAGREGGPVQSAEQPEELPPNCIEFALDIAPALEHIITSYPDWITVESIPLDDAEEQIELSRD